MPTEASRFVRDWYAPAAAEELLHYRSLVEQVGSADVLYVILARSARSARLTTHFDLDFPSAPQQGEYWCHKHKRTCRPVESARRFLLRYTLDTLDRIETFAAARRPDRYAEVLHGDARDLDLGEAFDGVVTSPPYPGLIDYHGQHRYAYELLGFDERRDRELGRPALGTGRKAIEDVRRRGRGRAPRTLAACSATARRSASSSTTAATSTARCSTGPGCGSSTGSSVTSTAARVSEEASTTSR